MKTALVETLQTKQISKIYTTILNNKNSIELKAVTWSKDSHGLFDYESKNIDIKRFKTTVPSSIYRFGILYFG